MADENKTSEELAAEKALAEKAAKAGTKSADTVSVDEIYKGYAAKATDKTPHIVSITDKFDMEFVKDFGEFKKGDTATVSMVAKDFYLANKAAKLAKDSE